MLVVVSLERREGGKQRGERYHTHHNQYSFPIPCLSTDTKFSIIILPLKVVDGLPDMVTCRSQSQAITLQVGSNHAVGVANQRPGVHAASTTTEGLDQWDSGRVDAKNKACKRKDQRRQRRRLEASEHRSIIGKPEI